MQTYQVKSVVSQVHDWVVYRLGDILGSVGYKVKIHKITPATGKELGDLEIKDHVVLQKPQEQDDRLPPPSTLIVDFTLTHTLYGRSHVHSIGQMTHKRRSDGAPEPDGSLRSVVRKKIFHYRQLYLDRPEPIAFMSVEVDTSVRIYDDFLWLLFLHAHREASVASSRNTGGIGSISFSSRCLFSFGHEDFHTTLICHLDPSHHYHISFVLGVLHHF